MADLGSYDQNAKPAESFDPVPPGKYIAMIVESDVVPTSQNTGEMLNLKFLIVDGEYEGRFVWDRINLRNNSQKAQEIGQRQLASLRLATGVNSPKASEELHNLPVEINVKIRPAGPDKNGVHRQASNEIKGYAAMAAQTAAPVQQQQASPPPPPVQQTAKPATGMPPWKRKAG